MTGKPQGALLEFKVSFSFFIIGLQAGEEVMLGGYNLLYRNVPFYMKHSVRICKNGVKSNSSRSIFKMTKLRKFVHQSIRATLIKTRW